MTRVSVVIPVLDQAAELDLQLAAVTAQHVGVPFEVLVADNGSTDQTPATIARWERADPRVRGLDASARKGPGAARNIAAEQATGDVLAFCDADDVVAPGWLAGCVAGLADAAVTAGAFDFGTLNGGRTDVPIQHYTSHFGYLPAGLGANLAVRTDAFRAAGGFDESLRAGEDIDLCWRLQLDGHRFATAPDAVVAKRERADPQARRRQLMSYGRHDVLLYQRYRERGMRRNDRLTLKTYAWLLLHAPLAVARPESRTQWTRACFVRAGRIQGSVAQHVFYP